MRSFLQRAWRRLLGTGEPPLPADPQSLVGRGLELHAAGRNDDAREAFLQAVALDPGFSLAHNNLGVLAALNGDVEAACAHFARAAAADPSSFDAEYNLGRSLMDAGRREEGDAALLRASRLPGGDRAEIFRALAVPLILDDAAQGIEIRAAIDAWLDARPALALEDPAGVDMCWYALCYHGIDDTARNRRIAEFFAAACPSLLYEAPHCGRARAPGERLKIGFISRFLYEHSVGKAAHGAIPRLSRDRFEVYALFIAPVVDDALSREIRDGADFAFVLPNALAEARRAIAELELDILFYQDIGMDTLTYFLAFARLAPTQCVTWGHLVSSGIRAMDFFISTEGFEPPGADAHYSERLLRLPEVATPSYYRRPDAALATRSRTEAGFEAAGSVYFCPQTLMKLHPDLDALFAGILRADAGGILYLLEYKAATYAAQLRRRFERTMPDVADRIRFLPRASVAHYYSRLKHAGAVLDPLHFCGGNTSLEAFALDTPVVTLPGPFMRSRMTLAMYRAMGIEDCIAGSPAHYVEIAVRLATDPAWRAGVSRRIAERSAVLYEDDRVVSALEDALLRAAQDPRR